MSIYPGAFEATLTVDGESVTYVDSRNAKDDVPPLVLVHGSGGTPASHFGALYPMFANRRRVIAVGYGHEGHSDRELTVQALATKVLAVLDHTVADSPVDIVGYSLGAAVAIELAASHPERVHTLSLVCGWIRTDAHQRVRNALWHELAQSSAETLARFSVLSAYGAPYLAKRTPAEIDGMLSRSKPGPDRHRQMALNAVLDVTEVATRVTAPTLVVGAKFDQMAPIHHSREILGAVPNARMATVKAGHAILTERPAEVFQLIDEFTLAPNLHNPGEFVPHITV